MRGRFLVINFQVPYFKEVPLLDANECARGGRNAKKTDILSGEAGVC